MRYDKRNKRKKDEEINFWQSSSDLMTALLFAIILIVFLLILFLIKIPEEDYTDYYSAEAETEYDDGGTGSKYDEGDDPAEDDDHEDDDGGGGGGGGSGDDDGDEPDEGEYPGESDGIKSAVFVEIIDAETEKTIKEEGVKFELYSSKGALQILNTYYPDKIEYKEYSTTDDGTFYLPEKILNGGYYLNEMTEAKGYEKAENVEFYIDRMYDWPDPYLVRVPLYPARDIIRIQMTDKDSGLSVAGGTFDVIADENVTTQDGTVRYKKGDIVGQITCNEEGYGESEKIYLGKYKVKQSNIPEYYAGITKEITAELKDLKNTTSTTEVKNERSQIVLKLADELTKTDPVKNAEFAISDGSEEFTARTDQYGQIILDEVDKDTTYTFTQTSSDGDYRFSKDPIEVKVDKSGRTDGKAKASVEAYNRILRSSVSVKDAVFGDELSNKKIEIYDKSEKQIKSWTSNGTAPTFTDLTEGEYKVMVNGSKEYSMVITDTEQVQTLNIRIITAKSVLAFVIGIGVIAAVIYFIQRLIRSKRKIHPTTSFS